MWSDVRRLAGSLGVPHAARVKPVTEILPCVFPRAFLLLVLLPRFLFSIPYIVLWLASLANGFPGGGSEEESERYARPNRSGEKERRHRKTASASCGLSLSFLASPKPPLMSNLRP